MDGLISLASGEFVMGSSRSHREEGPRRRVWVDAFAIDQTSVTNAQFAAFVATTGYVTVAEHPPDVRDYPDMNPALGVPGGSLVFHKPAGPVTLRIRRTVAFRARRLLPPFRRVPAARLTRSTTTRWCTSHTLTRKPTPPGRARRCQLRRSGNSLLGAGSVPEYAWGDQQAPGGAMLANYWQGLFPFANQCLDGWEGTSPTGSFPGEVNETNL
jgi:formylglycine-generating enzyme required for sulfatase activity